MSNMPIRHLFLLTVLLFVILSSGSLQCKLNCYAHTSPCAANISRVTGCHVQIEKKPATSLLASFCHHGCSSSQAKKDSILHGLNSGLVFTLFNSKDEAPAYHSATAFNPPPARFNIAGRLVITVLPLPQSLRKLRSTLLQV